MCVRLCVNLASQQDAAESEVIEYVARRSTAPTTSHDLSIDTDYWSDFLATKLRQKALHTINDVDVTEIGD
jgi:predicted GTPase